jgi:hypothetical protein
LQKYIDGLKQNLSDKEVLISDTTEVGSLAFNLAHIIRSYAKRTFCCGKKYKMINEKEGYRVIENGKVILIKGNLKTQREAIYKKVKQFKGKIDYEINIKEGK